MSRHLARECWLALLALTLFIGETSNTEYATTLLSMLAQLLVVLVLFIAPLLLFYGFAKSTVDAIKSAPIYSLTLLVASTFIEMVDTLFAVIATFFLILLPFFVLLLFWKGFTKVVKA